MKGKKGLKKKREKRRQKMEHQPTCSLLALPGVQYHREIATIDLGIFASSVRVRAIQQRLIKDRLVWPRLLAQQAAVEHKHSIPRVVTEKPVVDIPEDIHGHPVHQDRAVASELPPQPPHLQHDLAVDADHEGRVAGRAGVTVNRHIMGPAPVAELGSGPVRRLLRENVLPLGDEHSAAGRGGHVRVNLLERLLLHVSEKQDQLPLGGDSQIETSCGLRPLPEFSVAEIPVYVDPAGIRMHENLYVSVPSSPGEQRRLDFHFAEGLVG